jgi:hypothetical protein
MGKIFSEIMASNSPNIMETINSHREKVHMINIKNESHRGVE